MLLASMMSYMYVVDFTIVDIVVMATFVVTYDKNKKSNNVVLNN